MGNFTAAEAKSLFKAVLSYAQELSIFQAAVTHEPVSPPVNPRTRRRVSRWPISGLRRTCGTAGRRGTAVSREIIVAYLGCGCVVWYAAAEFLPARGVPSFCLRCGRECSGVSATETRTVEADGESGALREESYFVGEPGDMHGAPGLVVLRSAPDGEAG